MKHYRLSYKGKLLLYFTVLFAGFALLLVVFQQNRERQYRYQLLESRLRCYADMAAGSLAKEDAPQASGGRISLPAVFPSDLRLTVISRRGAVRFESDGAEPSAMGNHLDRPEVKMALAHGEGSDIRQSATAGRPFFYYAKSYGGFVVRTALPYDDQVRDFMKADNIFLWFVLMLFPVVLVVLIYIADHFGKSVAGLRHFISSAERGLVDYGHISFPDSELGEIGRTIMEKYKQLEESNRRTELERERLMRHFHYFEEGIAIFSATREKIYANPRFTQYVNTILDRPTANLDLLWEHPAFAPALEFIGLNEGRGGQAEQTPIFRFTIPASGNIFFALQLLIYGDGSFEMTLSDVTKTEKNRLIKQQMSNNITHELRTPVSSIRGYIETLRDCQGLTEEQRAYFLERAHLQAVRLTDLIRDVALITKVEEAPETMPREALRPKQLVDDIAEELFSDIAGKGMAVENCIAEGLELRGNYSLVYSIFRNLMENSLRYAGENTRIHMECYNEDREFAYFCYYDTGKGVAEEHLHRLFERFYRVGEGRTRDCGGTGLGLSIVRNAVLFHHGDISVRNRKGGGLEFLFTLKK